MSVGGASGWQCLMVSLLVMSIGIDAVVRVPPVRKVDNTPNEDHADYLARMRKVLELFREQPELVDQWNNVVEQQQTTLDPKDIYVPFECPPLEPSSPVPVSAHAVRPSDIKIVGALGDSITAANGVRANTPPQVAITNRGESWSIGGERNLEEFVLTIPNILRRYNPDIIGASDCRRGSSSEQSGLNVAIPGDTNRGMEAQAVEVMTLMLENPEIDYFNDWKLITLFIGGNDLCQSCTNNVSFSAEGYFNGVKAALDKFSDHLPRGIINLQPMFDVSIVNDMIHPGSEQLCNLLHASFCPCADGTDTLRNLQLEFFDKLSQLADGRYDTRRDFTVVLQPHLRDMTPWRLPNGSYDLSFVAPDCFHPNHKAHQLFAYMLWNTMFTPTWDKTTNYTIAYDDELSYVCPTEERPYIFTNLNSGRRIRKRSASRVQNRAKRTAHTQS